MVFYTALCMMEHAEYCSIKVAEIDVIFDNIGCLEHRACVGGTRSRNIFTAEGNPFLFSLPTLK
jgi:hypothetical protein